PPPPPPAAGGVELPAPPPHGGGAGGGAPPPRAIMLSEHAVEIPQEVAAEQVDCFMRFVLEEVQAGRGGIEEAEEILSSL
ncbi:MAG: hypothetical protein ACM3ZC_11555, partial [Bacteroidota bacterium]